jgi:16S rRNA (guanine527-N7)-methyltransferase
MILLESVMDQNVRHLLRKGAQTIGVALNDEALDRFALYARELIFWNRKINLTAIVAPEDIVVKHFIDSLTPLPLMTPTETRVLDIGSGGGFPGLPLKIARPSLKIALLESSRKKTSFLRHVIGRLQLEQMTVIHERVEACLMNKGYRGAFDVVVSRAAVKPEELLWLADFFLTRPGRLIVMKGGGQTDDMASADGTARLAGLVCSACHELLLPVTGDQRKLLIYQRDK